MKKAILTIAVVLTAMVSVSCDNICDNCNKDGIETIIEASMIEIASHQTKTSISEKVNGAVKYTWLAGDAINVFFGASESSIFVTNTTARVAQFKGTIGAVTGGGDDLTGETSLWGAYPYNSSTTCDGSSITMILPHEQESKADDLADDLFPSIARSTNFQMAFYPVCGSISFKVASSDIVKVTLSGNNNEKLAGKAKVSMELGGKPNVEDVTDGQTVLSITAPDGGCFEPGKSFYFVFYPSDFEKGLTLTYYKKDSYASFSYPNPYPIGRNEFGSISAKDGSLTFTKIEGDDDSDFNEEIPEVKVERIDLATAELTLAPGMSYQLEAKVTPTDATNRDVVYSSSNNTIAYVDEYGRLTAVGAGEAVITATAKDGSGISGSFTVTVCALAIANVEYIDEYGENRGYGIAIGDVVWAPVNCGYKAPIKDTQGNVTDKGYPYGKLYQWGRKYGQGYSTDSDSTAPSTEGETIVEGPVSINGQLESNANKFFTATEDWLATKMDNLWNAGTEDSPQKSDYDPCPEGWRVPTNNELRELIKHKSSWTTNEEKQCGYYFSGIYTYLDDAPQIFFPAAGLRYYSGSVNMRGQEGYYWSSCPDKDSANYLFFRGTKVEMDFNAAMHRRANGYSVRCVQK